MLLQPKHFGGKSAAKISLLALIVSAICNSIINTFIEKRLKRDNFVSFAIMVSYVFFGWTPVQVIICSLTGAFAELLFEIVLSPIGYEITKGWKAEKVGEEYIRSIS